MRDDNFDKRLGAWLKSKRIEKGYTMQFLADRLGVTRTAIHCWETGKRQLYASTLVQVCNALGADLDEFTRSEKHVSQQN